MKPVFQTRLGRGTGNCFSACLASIFEVPLEEVDHCSCENPNWLQNTEAWLAKRGLFYVEITIAGLTCTEFPTGSLVMLGGLTKTGVEHVVVAKAYLSEGKQCFSTVHDPYPEGARMNHFHTVIIFPKLMLNL